MTHHTRAQRGMGYCGRYSHLKDRLENLGYRTLLCFRLYEEQEPNQDGSRIFELSLDRVDVSTLWKYLKSMEARHEIFDDVATGLFSVVEELVLSHSILSSQLSCTPKALGSPAMGTHIVPWNN
ncbi:hypothetical protein BofuT4_P030140.1 [Botrytis cinerea T4]|uniref:Uncharacterized protein n=1 Tax=Botryotinia fuckeliana (strain T4) TaxID=999810 RepID=G2Y962_BOTF4|nr:hypothetical protein BofuT4_P030140.1 [Botrytis cinerea T4]